MKHIVLTTIFTLLFGCAVFAQTADPQSPSQGTTPSAEPGAGSQTSPAQAPDMGTPSQGSHRDEAKAEKNEKGEKKLKGCLRSEGGKFVLEEKHGKRVDLTSNEDLSSHVNHMVTVHGSFGNATSAAGANSTAASSGANSSASTSGEQFSVSKIDNVSDTCKGEAAPESGKPTPYHN